MTLGACSPKLAVPPPRYAILRLENLTSDPALNWIGRAASEVLIRETGAIPSSVIYAANEHFGGRPIGSPGVSTEFPDALLAGANRVVTGYFERLSNGSLRFHLAEEDAPTGKRLRDLTAQGPVLEACAALARQLTSSPKPYSTRNESALQAYILGVETGGPAKLRFYQDAVAADPAFSEAYLGWGEAALAMKDTPALDQLVASAAARKLDPEVFAKLEYADATAHDDTQARVAALKKLVEADPSNVADVRALGELEMAEHHFAEAAAAFAKAPPTTSPDLINLRTYALMFAGDENGALKAVHEYQKARPQDPNAIDSEGDIHYFFGQYSEAEKLYLSAAAKDPHFIQGGEMWKAARARLMTGDTAGATQLFERYRQERQAANDASIAFRAAHWQFLTGNIAGALSAMRQVSGVGNIALAQAAIWELQLGQRAEAINDAEAAIKQQGPGLIPAAIVRFSADPAGLAELQARANRVFGGVEAARIRLLAVGYALDFGNRSGEGVAIWKELYEKSDASDAVTRQFYARALIGAGRAAEGNALLKNMPPPAPILAPSFERPDIAKPAK